jgi:hypothetical protein
LLNSVAGLKIQGKSENYHHHFSGALASSVSVMWIPHEQSLIPFELSGFQMLCFIFILLWGTGYYFWRKPVGGHSKDTRAMPHQGTFVPLWVTMHLSTHHLGT